MTSGSRARPLDMAVRASRRCWSSRWRVVLARSLSFLAMPVALWMAAWLARSASPCCFQLEVMRFCWGSQWMPLAAGTPSSIGSGGSGGGLCGNGISRLCGDVRC